jgi:hypothetical protein
VVGKTNKEQGPRIKVKRGLGKDKDLKSKDILANISSDDNSIHSSFRVIGGENNDRNFENSGQA